jgi:hypothetical protein
LGVEEEVLSTKIFVNHLHALWKAMEHTLPASAPLIASNLAAQARYKRMRKLLHGVEETEPNVFWMDLR